MKHSSKDMGLDIIRVSTGLVMFLAGLNKVINLFNNKPFAMTPEMFGMFKPMIDAGLPWVELIIGVMLIVGLWTRYAAIANTILFAGITLSMGYGTMGIMPGLHTYILFISLGLALIGTSTCCTVDGLLADKKSANVQKIRV